MLRERSYPSCGSIFFLFILHLYLLLMNQYCSYIVYTEVLAYNGLHYSVECPNVDKSILYVSIWMFSMSRFEFPLNVHMLFLVSNLFIPIHIGCLWHNSSSFKFYHYIRGCFGALWSCRNSSTTLTPQICLPNTSEQLQLHGKGDQSFVPPSPIGPEQRCLRRPELCCHCRPRGHCTRPGHAAGCAEPHHMPGQATSPAVRTLHRRLGRVARHRPWGRMLLHWSWEACKRCRWGVGPPSAAMVPTWPRVVRAPITTHLIFSNGGVWIHELFFSPPLFSLNSSNSNQTGGLF
jgi:hypothetical protein